MMVESDGDLNQALQEFALGLGSGPPDILQDLVGFKELGVIKEDKALVKKTVEVALGMLIHGSRLAGFIRGLAVGGEKKARTSRALPASHGDSAQAGFLTRDVNHNTLNNIP
jgi:hypothetical protein